MNAAFSTAKMMNVLHPMLLKLIGVIFTTTKTNIQFQPDAIACIEVLVRVVLISEG
jgi:hypothetical protein